MLDNQGIFHYFIFFMIYLLTVDIFLLVSNLKKLLIIIMKLYKLANQIDNLHDYNYKDLIN